MPGIETGVLSFRDDLAPHRAEAEIYSAPDRVKLVLTCKAIGRLLRERDTLLYIQKAHFHAAAPFLLHRLGFFPNYILDYDDYDVPLSNFFARGVWNRLFFGHHDWGEITNRIARRAAGCVCASHELLDVLRPSNQQLAYIPTGVDTQLFTPREDSAPREETIFLWNGLVWGEPIFNNLILMFKAFDRAHAEMGAYRLRMIGGGGQWERVKKLADTEFARLPIEWQGWADPENMPALLRDADVGLLPAAGDDLWLRCKSPTKLFEYMASGLAVTASQVGEATRVLNHLESGWLARDERDFSQALIRLSNDAALRRRMGGQARRDAVDRYSLPILGENLYLFIKQLFPTNGR